MAKALRTFACAGAMLIFAAATASAQGISVGDGGNIGFSPFKQQEKRKLTPEEMEKQQRLDDAYKAATNKIPDQKANDPWAVVRPTSPAPAAKKKAQAPAQ
jgi:Spy/CpxP family protein refolding chaperone